MDAIFADDSSKYIFLNENVWIPIKISLKFVPNGLINKIQALVQIVAWYCSGDMLLSEPMMASLLMHICIARPQWVNCWTWSPMASMNQIIIVHYNDVLMGTIASQITSLTIVYSIVYSDADQRKHQSSPSLAFVRGIHRGKVNSPHKWPVTWKMFPFDDVIMFWYWLVICSVPSHYLHQCWSIVDYASGTNFSETQAKILWRKCIWVRSRNCGCLVTWFCYQLIAKPGNKTAAVPWPDPFENIMYKMSAIPWWHQFVYNQWASQFFSPSGWSKQGLVNSLRKHT